MRERVRSRIKSRPSGIGIFVNIGYVLSVSESVRDPTIPDYDKIYLQERVSV